MGRRVELGVAQEHLDHPDVDLLLQQVGGKAVSESPFENGVQWAIRLSRRLPMATWIMASETSIRCS
jgi:hypothetical protein